MLIVYNKNSIQTFPDSGTREAYELAEQLYNYAHYYDDNPTYVVIDGQNIHFEDVVKFEFIFTGREY